MKEVKAFKTNDGKIFDTEKEAAMHERECAFKSWYDREENIIGGAVRDPITVMDWLIKNKEAVLALYNYKKVKTLPSELQAKIDELSPNNCTNIHCRRRRPLIRNQS